MIPKSPCLKCEARAVGCHAKCRGYADYRKEVSRWSAKVNEERDKEADANGYEVEKMNKLKRRTGGQA